MSRVNSIHSGGICAFDIESTLTVEGFEHWVQELGDVSLSQKLRMVTDLGQTGEINFEESLNRRLDILNLDNSGIEQLSEIYTREIFKGAKEAVGWARENFERVVFISGGLRPALETFVREFNLYPQEDLYAIDYDPYDMEIVDSELSKILLRNNGKRTVFESVLKERFGTRNTKHHIVVGDGKTDAAVARFKTGGRDPRVTFIAVGNREKAIDLADYHANNLPTVRKITEEILSGKRARKQNSVVRVTFEN